MIEIDGSKGEGGGQVLRTSLTLSMITGQPFRIVNIRAGRAKPGLMRQHLVAVQAAAEVCGAEVQGAVVGALSLQFTPGPIKAGAYQFAIGTAGSCTLVLQTLLPALLYADAPSSVQVSGGTHNPKAPPAEFLQRSYCRALHDMGAEIEVKLERAGFYPAGGGVVCATVQPMKAWKQLALLVRGERLAGHAESLVAGVPASVALRELECVGKAMGWQDEQLRPRQLPDSWGPGNALLLTLEHQQVTEVLVGFGVKSVPSETIAKQVVQAARQYIASGAAVSEHLADQLMLPMALAGGGSFTVDRVTQHALTNGEIIGRFLPIQARFVRGQQHSTCEIGPLAS
jgi:RNA 3'-terminal phosphate cyclase (ATP)